MQRIGTRDTKPELALRSEIHRMGLRYRIDVAPVTCGRRRADIVFSASRTAVFVDGCFWHRCPIHGTEPKSNSEWWSQKLAMTWERDRDTDRIYCKAGWKVIRVWEHEDPRRAAMRVARVVRRRLELRNNKILR